MLILIVVMAVVLVVSGPPKVYPGDYPRTLRAFTLNILMVAGAGSLLFLNIGLRERSQAFFYADFLWLVVVASTVGVVYGRTLANLYGYRRKKEAVRRRVENLPPGGGGKVGSLLMYLVFKLTPALLLMWAAWLKVTF